MFFLKTQQWQIEKTTNNMTTIYQTNFLWVFIGVITLGIIDILIKIHRTKKEDAEIKLYWRHIEALYKKLEKGCDPANEVQYIIAKSEHVDQLLTNNSLCSPVFYYTDEVSKGDYFYQKRHLDLILKYVIQHEENNKKKRNRLRSGYFNPFELFYRGIELLLYYILGYFIKRFKSDFDYNSKIWKSFVGIISFISGLLTILGFFGFSLNS